MRRYIALFTGLVFTFISCSRDTANEVVPFAWANLDINLNNIQYQNLQNIGGYVIFDGGVNQGFKGIIVYHEGNGVYRAFERACTFDPYADCDPIEVDDSGLFMIHKCCNSTFDFHGHPIGGPATIDLVQYATFVDGIYLKIRNTN